MIRTIVDIRPGAGKLRHSTIIRLDCTHTRALGGHVLPDGNKPHIGDSYDCREHMCARIPK